MRHRRYLPFDRSIGKLRTICFCELVLRSRINVVRSRGSQVTGNSSWAGRFVKGGPLASVGAGVKGLESVSVYFRNNSSGTVDASLINSAPVFPPTSVALLPAATKLARIISISSGSNRVFPSVACVVYTKRVSFTNLTLCLFSFPFFFSFFFFQKNKLVSNVIFLPMYLWHVWELLSPRNLPDDCTV